MSSNRSDLSDKMSNLDDNDAMHPDKNKFYELIPRKQPNADNSDTIELFKNLYLDERTYKEFKDQDILLKSSKKHIIDLFSDLKRHFEINKYL